jgi:ABC-type transporter Mla maintaining outer membrane lipid asymmetry ATPase subunit MlaF
MPDTNARSEVPVITMRDVTVNAQRHPATVVARDVTWTVNAGEFWVVAGPQRSGKSDLLMMAGGLTPPTAGTYHFLGEPMPIFEEDRLAHRLKLSFLFDGGQLFNRMTLAENVALPLRYHHGMTRTEAEPRVRELMEAMELTSIARSRPPAVARNWQKRAGLARALALRPVLLLADNPLSGVDARHTAWWLNFLEQLRAGHSLMGGQPLTIVITCDDLSRVAGGLHLGAHYAVMNDGKFEIVGAREQLYASSDARVKELLTGELVAPTD